MSNRTSTHPRKATRRRDVALPPVPSTRRELRLRRPPRMRGVRNATADGEPRSEPRSKRDAKWTPNASDPLPVLNPQQALEFMNTHYNVVLEGGRTLVIVEEYDDVLTRWLFPRLTFADLCRYYANRRVLMETDANGKPTYQGLANFWIRHAARRTFKGVVFRPEGDKPGYYNLWRGFAVEPRPGNWSLLEAHMHEIVCRGDERLFTFFKGYLARGVQKPGEQGEVAVAMRGPEGAGKGIVVREYGSLFGQHFLHISDPGHLVGRFNLHLQDAVVVFVDEAFPVTDRSAIGALKRMITEPTLFIEAKYRNAIMAKNMTHVFIASNEQWVVPADVGDRRFLFLDVSGARCGDTKYFAAIGEQMNHGGREAMLDDLLHHDYAGIDLRSPPATAALLEQKLHSLSPPRRWWLSVLEQGAIPCISGSWETGSVEVYRDVLRDTYVDALRHTGTRDRGPQTELGALLSKELPGDHPREHQRGPERRRTYEFPPLAECRAHFEQRLKQPYVWPEPFRPAPAPVPTIPLVFRQAAGSPAVPRPVGPPPAARPAAPARPSRARSRAGSSASPAASPRVRRRRKK